MVVGLQTDPSIDRPEKNKPVQTYAERDIMLKSIRWVDEVVYYSTEADLLEFLKQSDVNVRIIGADWKGKEYTGHELNIPVVFNSRDHDYSTSSLRKRIYESEAEKES